MRQFNAPSEWPDPPAPGWRPPRRWRPPASWPAAPDGWSFWVDEHGRAVRGPFGRYGGPSRIKAGVIVVVPVALMTLVLVNPLKTDGSVSTAPAVAPTTTRVSAPATEAPTRRTEKPTRLAERSPTSTPEPAETRTPAEPTVTLATSPTLEPTPTPAPTVVPTPPPTTTTTAAAIVVYQNCAEVRAAGKAPLHRGEPGYSTELDHNGDGVACERGNS